MSKWYEQSRVRMLRSFVTKHLEEEGLLPRSKDEDEAAAVFWARVEEAGFLVKALELYDQFDDQDVEWVHRPRETKKAFAERIEREGRQAEVDAARKELLEHGYSLRKIHEQLVYRFQPQDGTLTRPWETPDPWEAGRLFRKKEDQDKFLAEAERDDVHDYCPESRWRFEWAQQHREKRIASENAKYRVDCAKWRQEERVALSNARRRAPEVARAEEQRKAAAKAEAERQAAAKAEAEKKAAEEKRQQEIREQEEAKKRKKEERNARRRELRRLRRHPKVAAKSKPSADNRPALANTAKAGDWETF